MKTPTVISAFTEEARLKRAFRKHFKRLGFQQKDGSLISPNMLTKEDIRLAHAPQRMSLLSKESAFVDSQINELSEFFADGREVIPTDVTLRLQRVRPGTLEARIFRIASLTWSVPVSNGFGRRLRYLVWDDNNGKLAGIFALGDPVYNLKVRDQHIGWSPDTKKENLVNVLDAYVLGAIPPYNKLLGGKAITCLIRSQEVVDDFEETYGAMKGVISQRRKNPNLLAVTTTSSMGRSSVYNRLTLGNKKYFTSLGYTQGWGHFHISDELFSEIRKHLRKNNHDYADGNRYGNGPNWKLRTIRTGLQSLGFDPGVLRHGIQREAYICELADNTMEILSSNLKKKIKPKYCSLLTVNEISNQAVDRWIAPRAERMPGFKDHKKEILLAKLYADSKFKPKKLSQLKLNF